MKPYEHYSVNALKTELQNLKNLSILVKDMGKPANFTYIDLVNLMSYLEELQQYIVEEIKIKS